ncbi:hypothetical protein GCM10027271_15880 [Saccharopolyspora gloriosae]
MHERSPFTAREINEGIVFRAVFAALTKSRFPKPGSERQHFNWIHPDRVDFRFAAGDLAANRKSLLSPRNW